MCYCQTESDRRSVTRGWKLFPARAYEAQLSEEGRQQWQLPAEGTQGARPGQQWFGEGAKSLRSRDPSSMAPHPA